MFVMNNLFLCWVFVKERSRLLVLVYSGMYLGLVIGLVFFFGLIYWFNWLLVFFFFGLLGVFWFVIW